jgi:ribulose-phosphate 3-epimerase
MMIIPSLLSDDRVLLLEQLELIGDAAEMIQIDIADGLFVPSVTWYDPKEISDAACVPLELHLMVQDPLRVIEEWTESKRIRRVLIHAESPCDHQVVIDAIAHEGWQASLVLNPHTDISVIEPFADQLFGVMCMGVVPGKQGQAFIPEVLDTLREIKRRFPHLFVELDGAVNMGTIDDIVKTDIDAVCPGSAIVGNARTPKENILAMQSRIDELTGETSLYTLGGY